MRRSTLVRSLLVVVTGAASAAAQAPRGPAPEGMPGAGGPPPAALDGATFLLAHTGELQLTDQQVVRLAAIARRTESRHRTLRATFDSARAAERRAASGDSARPRPPRGFGAGGPPPMTEQQMQQLRDQARADLRDAISVLTADQQAQAWEMVAMRRAGAMRAQRRSGPGREREGSRRPRPDDGRERRREPRDGGE